MKNEIEQQWLDAFPKLKKFGQRKYYLILDPVLIGIELIKIPRTESYRPHFVCYPLWKENLNDCFNKPLMLTEFHDKRGFQLSINSSDNFELNDVFQIIKNQLPIPFEEDVTLKIFFLALDKYASESYLSASPTSYFQALHHEHKLDIALILNDEKQIEQQLNKITNSNWNIEHFFALGIEYGKWLYSIENKRENRNKLVSLVKKNMLEKKLSKLNRIKINK